MIIPYFEMTDSKGMTNLLNKRRFFWNINFMSKTVYIKLKQQYNAKHKSVKLGEICDLIAYEDKISVRLRNHEIYNYEEKIRNIRPKRTYTAIISLFSVIKEIKKLCGNDVEVVNVGQTDTVVEYTDGKKVSKSMTFFKCILASVLIFFGAAFTIMAFNNDISISGVFERFYFQMIGEKKPEFSELELMYSIGLALGIIVFFNHIGGRKLSDDVTPIEVELYKHKNDTLDTIVELKQERKE